MTPEELASTIGEFVEAITPTAELAAECYKQAYDTSMHLDLLPDSYLAAQWIVWSHSLRQERDLERTEQCLQCIRSIALCMRATGFANSDKFLEVITTIADTYHQLQSVKEQQQ